MFNPYEIDETVTLDNLIGHLKQEEYLSAMIMALKLNEEEIIDKVFKCIPMNSISLISSSFPSNYLYQFLEYLCNQVEASKEIEWNMHWLRELLKYNEHILKGCRQDYHSQAFSMN